MNNLLLLLVISAVFQLVQLATADSGTTKEKQKVKPYRPQISARSRQQIQFMRGEYKEYKRLICSETEVPKDRLDAVDACYKISLFEVGHEEHAFETCRKTVFGGRRSRDEIRQQLCANKELMRWFGKCISDLRYKKYGDLMKAFGSNIDELLEKIWPLYMERQICLKEAMGVKMEQNGNDVDGQKKDKENLKRKK